MLGLECIGIITEASFINFGSKEGEAEKQRFSMLWHLGIRRYVVGDVLEKFEIACMRVSSSIASG